jgi:hypothetical protein
MRCQEIVRKKFFLVKILFFPLLVSVCSCQNRVDELFKNPDTNPIRKVLKITMPLAYAANLAMAALDGAKLPNVSFINAGDSTNKNFLMAIAVDSNFPIPKGIQAGGRVLVAGSLAQGVAMMTVMFTDLKVIQGKFIIHDISTFPVIQDVDLVTGKKVLFVVYADMDVDAGSDTLLTVDMSKGQTDAEFKRYQNMKSFDGSVIVEQNTWMIQVDDNGTPGDPGDDTYLVLGGGQYVETGSSSADIMQIVMMNVAMKATCKQNPAAGWTLVQNLSGGDTKGPELGHLLLNGHSECDGTMKVVAATGVYTRSWGKPVALNLSQ